MRWIGAAAQDTLDFLVDERCHACSTRLPEPWHVAGEPHPLARPVEVAALGPIRLHTRVLCRACAEEVRVWCEPWVVCAGQDAPTLGVHPLRDVAVVLPGATGHAVPIHPAFVTDERLLVLIRLLKFSRRSRIAPWLARAMAGVLAPGARDAAGDAVLVPVPMDRRAVSRRGFNQAERIAAELGVQWSLPVAARALVKRHATRRQSSLGRAERLTNLAGVFAPGTESVRGATAIVVDDLVTTGATVIACARALVDAGAASVRGVCAGFRPEPVGSREDIASSILTMTSSRRYHGM